MRRRAIIAAVGFVLLCCRSATAQNGEQPRERALAAFERGNALVRVEQWEEAHAAFSESLRLFPTRTALFNRALCLGFTGGRTATIRRAGRTGENRGQPRGRRTRIGDNWGKDRGEGQPWAAFGSAAIDVRRNDAREWRDDRAVLSTHRRSGRVRV